MRVEIDCVNKDDRYNPYERILRVGGPNGDGSRWNLPLDEAVQGALSGQYEFFVLQNGHFVDVVVARSRFGNQYLKTEADYDTPDNLLSLRECPLT